MPTSREIRHAQRALEDTVGGLLERVRARLKVDTAVVLTLDPSRTVLEPFAMSGVNRVRRAWARVPVGKGFAGRIVSTRGPVVLDEVTHTNVYNPVLREQGVRSLAGVPLIDHDRVIGVLHVGSFTARRFGDRDLARLAKLASDLVETIRDETSGIEHTASLVLQRSLMPTILVSVPGLEIAGRYLPAEGDLGGDWYDVFSLPDGRLAFVIGDVVGHGLGSAVVMGRLKSALRAYALMSADPAEVLALLDRKISHFEPDVTATVVYGVLEKPHDVVRFSSAGHWPPVVCRPDGPATMVAAHRELPLGVDVDAARTTSEVTLEPGAVVCLFTDGLLELDHRKAPDEAASELMRAVKLLDPTESADLNCSRLLADFVGSTVNQDDIALLLIRRTDDVASFVDSSA